jgi:transcriptional regulatory protein RtcR
VAQICLFLLTEARYIPGKGMIFLDEIGELGLDEQAMLLRAFEEKHFPPMGSDREVDSDFQLICGTNQNLQKNAVRGTFRQDLLERINLWTFYFPYHVKAVKRSTTPTD